MSVFSSADIIDNNIRPQRIFFMPMVSRRPAWQGHQQQTNFGCRTPIERSKPYNSDKNKQNNNNRQQEQHDRRTSNIDITLTVDGVASDFGQ
jgi:hypothetical protein